jgi:hypothetical protein
VDWMGITYMKTVLYNFSSFIQRTFMNLNSRWRNRVTYTCSVTQEIKNYSEFRIYFYFLCPFLLYCTLTVSRFMLFYSLNLYTIGRTPWTGDRPVARPVPKYRTAQTQNKRAHTRNIHAVNGNRTHDHSVRASEDSSYLRPLGYRDRRI